MLLLAIESSGPACSAALAWTGAGDRRHLEQRWEAGGRRQADRLIPLIESLMVATRRRYAEIDVIAVGAGPGSFTGVRTAVAAARALALAMERPVVPVTTLEALAWMVEAPEPLPLLAVIDARRGEVYAQPFAADRSPEAEPRAASPAEAAALVVSRRRLVGTGGSLLLPHLDPDLVAGLDADRPDAGGVARAAEARLGRGAAAISGFELTPVYLREPDARPMDAARIPGAVAAHPGGP